MDASHGYEEIDQDFDMPMARSVVLGKHGNDDHQLIFLGAICFDSIIPQLMNHAQSVGNTTSSTMFVGVAYLSMLMFVIAMDSRLLQSSKYFGSGFEVYITAASVVLTSYALLLLMNTRYISLAIIPTIMLVFIGALCRKFWVKGTLPEHDRFSTVNVEKQLILIVSVLPFLLQLSCMMLAPSNGQEDGIYVSHFLAFFSSALGALATMIAALPAGVCPGVAGVVLPVLHKACIVLLLMTVHTIAAEWLGTESMALACMPELVAALMCFSVYLHKGGSTLSVHTFRSHISNGIGLCAVLAVWAYLEYTRTAASRFWSISWLSGWLCGFSSWILNHWPGECTQKGEHARLLLLVSALICFLAPAVMAILLLTRWVPMEKLIALAATAILYGISPIPPFFCGMDQNLKIAYCSRHQCDTSLVVWNIYTHIRHHTV